MGNQVTLTFAGDATSLDKANAQARASIEQTAGAAGTAARDVETRMGRLGAAAAGMSTAVDDAGGTIGALADLQSAGARRAAAHARALVAVEQATNDARMATVDLATANNDLKLSFIDAENAVHDQKQSLIDAEAAQLAIKQAQNDYNDAVKEFGKNSLEAQAALLAEKQARQDLARSTTDMKEALADEAEARNDGQEAIADMRQAEIDAKNATLDLADAQREANPTQLAKWAGVAETAVPAVLGLVGAVNLLTMAHAAFSLTAIRSAAAAVATRAATLAGAAATGIATAAQWAWNTAMTANPIGLIIVAIGALVAAIVWIATRTTWFQSIWRVTWTNVKKWALSFWDWLKGLPSAMGSVFGRLASIITAPWRLAFNSIARAWNATVGRLSFSVPSWIPGIGGNSFSAPRIPTFHKGGVVPGAPGSEMLAVLQAGETVVPAGAGVGVRVVIDVTGGDDELKRLIRKWVRVDGGGSVQVAFGR